MDFKEWFYQGIPNNLSLFYDGKEEYSATLHGATPNNTGKSKEFLVGGVKFYLEANIDAQSNTTITIYAISNDASIDYELFDIEFDTSEDAEAKPEKPLRVSLYTPALPYTRTTSSVLYGLSSRLKDEKQLIPILLVTKDDRFEAYRHDENISSKHFLNLCNMQFMKNREKREAIKASNKEVREFNKRFGNELHFIKPQDQLITPEYEPFGVPEVYAQYRNPEIKREIAIPVFCWDIQGGTMANLDVFLKAIADYPEMAVSVSHFSGFNPEEIAKKLEGKSAYFLLDYGASYNTSEIELAVEKTLKVDKSTTVYLGASFAAEDLTVSKDNAGFNYVFPDKALIAYKQLSEKYPALGYGDYCGYDKYTVSEFVGGTIPAKVVLHSFSDSTILVRRDFDEKDSVLDENGRIKTGYRRSMIRLLTNIVDGVIPPKYLDETLCDADGGLKSYKGKATTPGNIKTLCFRHNIIAIMRVAMRLRE